MLAFIKRKQVRHSHRLLLLLLLLGLCHTGRGWAMDPAGPEPQELSPVTLAIESPPADTESGPAMDAGRQKANMTPDEMALEDMMMLGMQRDGSGTAWQPMDNPMAMIMRSAGPWMMMLHGSAFLDYDNQGGRHGRTKMVSQNWLMGSAQRPVGQRGIFQVRGMLTGEPFTVGKTGYPLLFQTGEAVGGQPLIDYQHPHDLFMELMAQTYTRLGEDTWLRLYLAPSGEPALGPVAYPHRYSAMLDPMAPLSHHIMDSTHVSFGVMTAGLIHKNWQVEGSIFNGKEPDEYRYDFDFGSLTSYAGRISYLPDEHWAFQVSDGFLDDPEQLEPGDVDRLTASAMYDRTTADGWWATTLAFGHNFKGATDDTGLLLESTWNFRNRNYLYGRVENVQKSELLRSNLDQSFNITAFTLGLARDLFSWHGIPLTLGAQLTMYAKPSSLNPVYSDFPVSFNVYLHTNAPRMGMSHMEHNHATMSH